MMRLSVLCLFTVFAGSLLAATDWEMEAREAQWEWPREDPNVLSAAMRTIESPYEVVIVRLPLETAVKRFHDVGGFYPLDLKFVRDGTVLFQRPAHESTVFLHWKDRLIFADVPTGTFGCKIIAFDLAAKKQLWEAELKALGPTIHFAYWSKVSLSTKNGALQIYGWETHGKYLEYIDLETGKPLGHRVFER